LVGSLQPGLGGSVIAPNTSLSDIQSKLNEDPFGKQDIVSVKILEIDPKKADKRVGFLLS
jgi:glycine cleavage system H lipoate-binding protein